MMVDIPPAVRLLPMDSEEPEFRGKSRDAVQQDFFLDTMPSAPNPGRFQYREHGLVAKPGTVVLFQFDRHIIASAVLVRRERYPEPAGPYNGALWFDPRSIRVFSSVGADSVRKHWPEHFARFGNVMQKLEPPSRYPAFEQELSGIKWPARPAPQAHDLEAPPAARVQTTVSRIVRDTQLTNRVKAMHSYKCQICGHTILLADGTRYAEGHHVQPLGEPHNGPDVTENIICVCPNHHAACDLGAICLDLAQLRKATGHCVSQLYIDYHNETICRALNA